MVAVCLLLTARRKLKRICHFLPAQTGWWGRRAGQWRGRAITRAQNCCPQQSPVSSAQSRHLRGVSSRQLELKPSIPNVPEQVQITLTVPSFHIFFLQESQLMAMASGLPPVE